MSWKNRKLFNNLPQGIVSGLEPIPRYQMGGMVQGYETGGSFPNKGLEALNKVAPDVVKTIMSKEDGGFVNPRNYVDGGTVEYPIGMEAGTLVPEENFMEKGINNMLESLGIETDVNKVTQNKRDKTERKNKAISEANNFIKNLMAEYMDGTKTGGDFTKEYGGIGDLKLRYIEKKYPDVYEDFYSNQLGLNSKLNRATETFDQAIGMEAGALVPEVFESGDQQINEALNTMLATTMPTGDATTSVAMEEPTGDVADILPEATTGDSSSKESLFVSEVNQQKKILQDTIEKVIAEKTQEDIDPITLKTQITDFITKADSLFKRKVTDIANKLNVEVMPEQVTLLTDDFSTKLETMFPNVAALESDEEDMQVAMTGDNSSIAMMEEGGLVETAIKNQEELVKKLEAELNNQITRGDRGRLGGGTSYIEQARKRLETAQERLAEFKKEGATSASIRSTVFTKEPSIVEVKKEKEKEKEKTPSPSLDTSLNSNLTSPNLSDLLKQNADAVKNAALMTGKTKQGGISGFMDVVGQANLLSAKAERENLLNQLKVEAETTALGDKYEEAAFASAVDQLDETGAVEFYILNGRPLPKSRQNIIPAGELDNRNFAAHLKFIRSSDKTTPFETIVADFRAKAA